MDKKDIKKEYTNGELTVVWQPAKCIHSEICVKTLPEVYDPKAKPWIRPENTSTQELKDQVDKCPSGALSYYMNGEENKKEEISETRVEVLVNGPLLIHGKLNVIDKEGNKTVRENKTTFCRCGASSNKPYCDGTHRKIGFEG